MILQTLWPSRRCPQRRTPQVPGNLAGMLGLLLGLPPAGAALAQTTTYAPVPAATPPASPGQTTVYSGGQTTTYGPSDTGPALRLSEAEPSPTYAAAPPSYESQAGTTAISPAIHAGPVTLTFGGFSEFATIYRNRNEVSDVASDFNTGIPFGNTQLGNESEFRESARQSRFSLLAQGEPYDGATAELYMETDFLSAGVTSNSRESNSYTLRLRHYYGRFKTDFGLDVLAGQTWSLATLLKTGMSPRDEDIPLTIDAQYVVGFDWLRNPQLRIVQHFTDLFSVGVSIESPQGVTSNGINFAGGAGYPPGNAASGPNTTGSLCSANSTVTNCGDAAGLLNSSTTYTIDTKPDIILKAALDPGFGHYEVYGLTRWFTSNVARTDHTVNSGAVGAGAILPLVPKVLSVQASGLYGKGIGRYGSAQLPDVTMKPDGELTPLKGLHYLFGLTFTPGSANTLYFYYGRERTSATWYSVAGTTGTELFGYGLPTCNATTNICTSQTNWVEDFTAGWWWKFYQGMLGNAQFGVQGAYLQRDVFGVTPFGGQPSANIFIGMVSLRYYPYQH